MAQDGLATNPENCGTCGVRCLGEHDAAKCSSGTSDFTCDDGFVNLGGVASNGCECELASESEVACDDGIDDDCERDVVTDDADCAGSTHSEDVLPGDVDVVDAGSTADGGL